MFAVASTGHSVTPGGSLELKPPWRTRAPTPWSRTGAMPVAMIKEMIMMPVVSHQCEQEDKPYVCVGRRWPPPSELTRELRVLSRGLLLLATLSAPSDVARCHRRAAEVAAPGAALAGVHEGVALAGMGSARGGAGRSASAAGCGQGTGAVMYGVDKEGAEMPAAPLSASMYWSVSACSVAVAVSVATLKAGG
jgi:hypothetical protein